MTRDQGTAADAAAAAIAAEFDHKAPGYETSRLAPWYEAQASLVLKHLGPMRGPVLDVGCGTGWFVRRFVEANPGARAIGVDLSPGMIAEARRYAERDNLTGAQFVTGDWEARDTEERIRDLLPGGASAVVCVSTLHYFRAPRSAARTMRRLLVPGGRLLLVERSRDRSILTSFWDILHRKVILDHVQFYREAELVKIMVEAGFSDTRTLARVHRLLWNGKLFTSLALLEGRASTRSRPQQAEAGNPD